MAIKDDYSTKFYIARPLCGSEVSPLDKKYSRSNLWFLVHGTEESERRLSAWRDGRYEPHGRDGYTRTGQQFVGVQEDKWTSSGGCCIINCPLCIAVSRSRTHAALRYHCRKVNSYLYVLL